MYCVSIKDADGQEVTIEVSYEVYKVFQDYQKLLEKQRDEQRRHWDKRGLEDYIIANESVAVSETLEDLFFSVGCFTNNQGNNTSLYANSAGTVLFTLCVQVFQYQNCTSA